MPLLLQMLQHIESAMPDHASLPLTVGCARPPPAPKRCGALPTPSPCALPLPLPPPCASPAAPLPSSCSDSPALLPSAASPFSTSHLSCAARPRLADWWGPFLVYNRPTLSRALGNATFLSQCRHSLLQCIAQQNNPSLRVHDPRQQAGAAPGGGGASDRDSGCGPIAGLTGIKKGAAYNNDIFAKFTLDALPAIRPYQALRGSCAGGAMLAEGLALRRRSEEQRNREKRVSDGTPSEGAASDVTDEDHLIDQVMDLTTARVADDGAHGGLDGGADGVTADLVARLGLERTSAALMLFNDAWLQPAQLWSELPRNLLSMHHLNASGLRQLATMSRPRAPFRPCETVSVSGNWTLEEAVSTRHLTPAADGLIRPRFDYWLQDRTAPFV